MLALATALALALDCEEGRVAVQVAHRPLESDGCSKPAFLQVVGEEDFSPCCDLHDACYEVCGQTQRFCDQEFQRCMSRMCVSASNEDCPNAVAMYMTALAIFGGHAFDESQQTYCVCVESARAKDQWIQVARAFYSTHSPEKEAAFFADESGLAKYVTNYGTEQRPVYTGMALLLYMLHRKYPSAIALTGARRQGRAGPVNQRRKSGKTSKKNSEL